MSFNNLQPNCLFGRKHLALNDVFSNEIAKKKFPVMSNNHKKSFGVDFQVSNSYCKRLRSRNNEKSLWFTKWQSSTTEEENGSIVIDVYFTWMSEWWQVISWIVCNYEKTVHNNLIIHFFQFSMEQSIEPIKMYIELLLIN
jgi:hypothetical protein